jgi:hypothetical protein
MTITTTRIQTKKIFSGILAITLLLTVYSCAKKTSATTKTEVTPASETAATLVIPEENKGQVQIKRDVSGNYVVQINLRELEALNKVEETSNKAYIVWMNAANTKAKNLGQIKSNSGWLTDKSKASFEAVSVVKPTKIFITEEVMAEVKKPGKNIIWTTNTF